MSSRSESPPRRLLPLLAMAAITELVLLRLLTRTLVNIPGMEALRPAVRLLGETGRLLYALAVVLLAAVAVALLRERQAGRVVPAVLAGFLVLATAARAEVAGVQLLGWGTMASVAALAALTARRAASRLPVALLSAAFLLGSAVVLLQPSGLVSPLGVNLLVLGAETSALAGLVTTPLLLGARVSRRSAVVGAVVGMLVTLALLGPASPVDILFLWAFGLSAALPMWAHGLAAGFASAAVVEALARGRTVQASGLALLVAGGFGLASSYQSALFLAGLAALAIREEPAEAAAGEEPSPARRPIPVSFPGG